MRRIGFGANGGEKNRKNMNTTSLTMYCSCDHSIDRMKCVTANGKDILKCVTAGQRAYSNHIRDRNDVDVTDLEQFRCLSC